MFLRLLPVLGTVILLASIAARAACAEEPGGPAKLSAAGVRRSRPRPKSCGTKPSASTRKESSAKPSPPRRKCWPPTAACWGNLHQDIAFDLDWLAERYEKLEKFAAAKDHRTEALAIQTARLGKEHWQVTNARWALQTTELLASLSADQRRQFDLARARSPRSGASVPRREVQRGPAGRPGGRRDSQGNSRREPSRLRPSLNNLADAVRFAGGLRPSRAALPPGARHPKKGPGREPSRLRCTA